MKLKPNGENSKYKAWLVEKGFLQKPEIDSNEVYAPVARLETIILVISISAHRG